MPVDIFEAENIDFDNKSNPVDVFEAENISPKKNKKVSFLPTREELNKAEKDFSKMSGEVLRETPYYAQGAVKEPFKMANVLLPENYQVPINKLKLAEKVSPNVGLPERKEAESLGGLLGMGAPRAGIMGGLKAAQGIPHIGNVIKKAMEASPILNKLFDVGGKGAEFGLYEAAEHPENSLQRGALGFGLGAGLSGLGYGIPAVARKLGYGKQPGENVIEGLNYKDIEPQIKSGKRLGTPLQPSEATMDPYVTGLEKEYPKTREASKRNVELGKERSQSEKNAINKLLRTVYDNSKKSNNEIKSLYGHIKKWNLKPNVMNQLKQDPLIEDAILEVSKDRAWQRNLGNIPENNVAYLDKVKRELWDKEKGLRVNAPGKAEEYKQARNNLVGVLDKAVPGYEKARNMSELKNVRKEIKKKMREEEISGSSFYSKIIKNDDQYQKLLGKLRNNPKAISMLEDMKKAWKGLINLPTSVNIAHQKQSSSGMIRETLQLLSNKWNEFINPKNNKKAVEFLRSDAWVKKLRDAQKTGKKEDVEKAVNDIMIKILPVSDFLIEENSK